MAFQILHPDELDPTQKTWLALAICEAILADGNIAPEELEYLEDSLSFLPSKQQVEALMQAVKDQKLPELQRLPNPTRMLETQIFLELVLVMTSDNNLSTLEMNYLFQVGQKLGFGKEFTRVVLRWASEGVVWRRKMQHLIQVGSELEAEYDL